MKTNETIKNKYLKNLFYKIDLFFISLREIRTKNEGSKTKNNPRFKNIFIYKFYILSWWFRKKDNYIIGRLKNFHTVSPKINFPKSETIKNIF